MTGEVLEMGPLQVDPAEVYRYLGVRGTKEPSPAARRLVGEACEVGSGLLRPAAARLWRSASYAGSLLGLDGEVLDTGRALKGWRGLDKVAICLCTIGPALEGRVNRLFQEDEASLAVALDAFGSAAVETLGARVHDFLCAEASAEGMNVGARGEAGTGKWDLHAQAVLFAMFAPHDLDIRLTESLLLLPRKSLCFVVPAGARLTPTSSRDRCRNCDMVTCAYRVKGRG